MKRVYISTHYRLEEGEEVLGELGHVYILDWDTKELLCDPRGIEPDYRLGAPLGRSHGARGITYFQGKLYVAGSDNKISVFDPDSLGHIKTIEKKEFKALHQIKGHNGLLHVVSTGLDQVVRLKDDEVVAIDKLDVNRELLEPYVVHNEPDHGWGSDHLHFNSITWSPKGEEYHTYFSARMVFNYTKRKIVYAHGLLDGPHDVMFADNKHLLVSSSKCRSLVEIDVKSKQAKIIDQQHPWAGEDAVRIMGFTRGVAIADDLVLSCSAPTKIVSLKKNNRNYKKIEEFNLNKDPKETIYDIALDPRDWGPQC